MNKICLACRKSFVPTKGNLKKGMGKFCSRECYWKSLKGGKLPSSTKEKIKNSIIKRWKSGSFKGTTGMKIRRRVYPIIICPVCNKKFHAQLSTIKRVSIRFCSKDCCLISLRSGILNKKLKTHLSKIGKLGADKRWQGHIKVNKPIKLHGTKKKYTHDKNLQLEKKRFRNQRYKARKKNALGSHTFEEWLALKQFYGNMCLCCKRCEPEIKLSEDHIIPLDKGGSDYIENIQPLCVSCNSIKHTKAISYLPVGINGSNFAPPN